MGFATEGEKMDKSIIIEWVDKVNHILKPVSSRQKFIESIKNKGMSIEENDKIEKKYFPYSCIDPAFCDFSDCES